MCLEQDFRFNCIYLSIRLQHQNSESKDERIWTHGHIWHDELKSHKINCYACHSEYITF